MSNIKLNFMEYHIQTNQQSPVTEAKVNLLEYLDSNKGTNAQAKVQE